ncbi:hypothetical protein OG21DRAFT_664911 [Imleria badia]|nr:hypothetical protein OG21DRAFT_664911 [Imleria badia]
MRVVDPRSYSPHQCSEMYESRRRSYQTRQRDEKKRWKKRKQNARENETKLVMHRQPNEIRHDDKYPPQTHRVHMPALRWRGAKGGRSRGRECRMSLTILRCVWDLVSTCRDGDFGKEAR